MDEAQKKNAFASANAFDVEMAAKKRDSDCPLDAYLLSGVVKPFGSENGNAGGCASLAAALGFTGIGRSAAAAVG